MFAEQLSKCASTTERFSLGSVTISSKLSMRSPFDIGRQCGEIVRSQRPLVDVTKAAAVPR